MLSRAWLLSFASLPLFALASGPLPVAKRNIASPRVQPNGRSEAAITPGALRVTENSGVCETTPGVYQASGYGDIAANKSVFFWFFEARNNPDTAPLTVWFDGGPGVSSMQAPFFINGPCRVDHNVTSVEYNPYSWNNDSNLLFIDQPIGVGFSYGDVVVNNSNAAAADVWSFMQIWLKDSRFSKYQNADLGLWTESYGGHYGPAFADHFLSQNAAIAAGTVSGLTLNLKNLGIGNGLTDASIQYANLTTYAQNNPYHPLLPPANISQGEVYWNSPGGCKEQISNCHNTGSDTLCYIAQIYCLNYLVTPLAGGYNVYDVRSRDSPYPDDAAFAKFLASVQSKLGAEGEWKDLSAEVYALFLITGDTVRTYKPALERVINAGVRTLLFDGDADYLCNFHGQEALADALETKFAKEYRQQNWSDYKVAGQSAGQYKQAGNFSYLRVYGAGHSSPAYKYKSLATGQSGLQYFNQIISGKSLSST